MTVPDPAEDALEAYALAHERVRLARQRWAEAGEPFTMVFSNRVEGGHPLWKALLEAEAFAERMRENVRLKHRGPDVGAVVQATIGLSPAAKLRAVK